MTDAEIKALSQKIVAAALKLGATLGADGIGDANNSKSALAFVVAFGIVSLFADMAYEGMRGMSGPFLAIAGRQRRGGRAWSRAAASWWVMRCGCFRGAGRTGPAPIG